MPLQLTIQEIFEKYYKNILYYARERVRATKQLAIQAEDVVQSVFLRLWKGDIELEPDKELFYIFRMIRNACIDIQRKEFKNRRFGEEVLFLLSEEEEDRIAIDALVIMKLYEQRVSLPTKCRQVFEGYWDGLETGEIADKLGISCRNVINQRTTAVNKLRDWLLDSGLMPSV